MKLTSRPLLFHLLLLCATQTSGVEIQSVPAVDTDGVIETELEKSVSLVCRPAGGLDAPLDAELVWLRNGAVVSLAEGNRKGRSSVCVTPVVHDDDGAAFSCHLRKNATVAASVTLNVKYPPQLSGSEAVAVEEEAELVLRCDILANPPVSSVSWTLNGSTVDLLAGGFSLAVDGLASQLAAAAAERGVHEGTYRCTATSPLYGEYSKQFSVTVTEKTVKFPLMPTVAGVVVVCLTALFAVVSRWNRLTKCCK